MADPTSVTQYQQGFAPAVEPYAMDLLDATKQIALNNPYQNYSDWAQAQGLSGDQTAQFTDLQKQAFAGATALGQDPRSLQAASGLGALATQAGNLGYSGTQFGSQYRSPTGYTAQGTGNLFQNTQGAYSGTQFGNQFQTPGNVGYTAMGTQAAQAQGPMMVGGQNFGQSAADQYMSPYMQSVVERQQRDAQRQADIATTSRNAQAVRAGAFGGTRQAVTDAMAARDLALQKGDIQATGLQQAFNNAQQQFNADQARSMQGQTSNQGAWLQTNLANAGYGQQANLANQSAYNTAAQFGAGQNLTAAGLRAQYGQAANQLNMQQQQYGYGQGAQADALRAQYGLAGANLSQADRQYAAQMGMTDAQYAAQFGQSANQLNMQQQQFGANLGLQGLQAGMQGYNSLGSLGQNLFGQTTGIYNMQNQMGTQQQQQAQNMMNTSYQNFLQEQNYPYKNLGFMSDVLRGAPVSAQGSTVYQAPPSLLSQVAGLGTAAYGLMGGTVPKKKGGAIKAKQPSGLQSLFIKKLA